ncbi:MAG TPA: PIN domain-containing protein [Chloroflexia bacterium]|jgi:predicted nucleic acid-binding protein
MPARIRVFIDTSALFAGVWSAEGGSRLLLKLAEAGAIEILISPQVLTEAEGALRRKAPDGLGLLALLLHYSQVEIVPSPSHNAVAKAQDLTGHAGDAQVLAAALEVQTDYFVTLDRQHFLNNVLLTDAVPFPVGTPGDFLSWFRGRVTFRCLGCCPNPEPEGAYEVI